MKTQPTKLVHRLLIVVCVYLFFCHFSTKFLPHQDQILACLLHKLLDAIIASYLAHFALMV
jgi:hypothetical protein